MIKVGLVVLAFIGGLLAFFLFSNLNMGISELAVTKGCDLNDAAFCEAVGSEGQRLSLQLSPRPIPLLKAVEINLQVTEIDLINTAQLAIEGVNMYMGLQVIPLHQNQQQPNLYTGVMQLPICSTQTMHWMATVHLNTHTRKLKAAFPFSTTSP